MVRYPIPPKTSAPLSRAIFLPTVYFKEGDSLKPTWLNQEVSEKTRFALKTGIPENTVTQFVVLYENDAGEQLVSEVSGKWQKD